MSRAAALTLAAGVLLAGAPPASGATRPSSAPDVVSAPGVIIRWAEGTNGLDRTRALRAVGLGRGERLELAGVESVAVPAAAAADLADRLARDPAVEAAEPDALIHPATTDPDWSLQWALHNPTTSPADIDAPQAWAALPANPAPVVVAVIDTGVDLSHPDLAASAWTNPGEIAGNGLDDDGNGFVDDVSGWDFVHEDSTLFDPTDLNSRGEPADQHGTHVAGIIGAQVDNAVGVAGVAPTAQIMALKAIGPTSGRISDALEAIAYAEENGAQVLNASWGSDTEGGFLQEAIRDSGLLFLAAAGNGGSDALGDDLEVDPQYPAAFRLPNLVSVAATDRFGDLATFSNYSSTLVDVAAPGRLVWGTLPAGAYANMSGTSMATPHVAGIGALLASVDPDLTGAELATLIKGSVTPLAAAEGMTVTGGLVNAASALEALAQLPEPGPEPTTGPSPSPSHGPGPSPSQGPGPSPSQGPGPSPSQGPGPSPSPSHGPGPSPSPEPSPSISPTPEPSLPVVRTACPSGVPSAGFTDVARDSVHAGKIDCAVWWSLANGVGGGAYGPERQVTRAQMASFLAAVVKAAGRMPAAAGDHFGDDNGIVHEANINALAELGVVRGTGPGSFSPQASVTRAQMATFLVGLQELLAGTPMEVGPTPFTDADGVHGTSIAKAYTARLTSGVNATTYGAGNLVRRDQIATFLMNEVDLLVRGGQLLPRG